MGKITTKKLAEDLDNYKVIDIRSIDAYNGWKESGEARGGHIKGAKTLPYKWLHYIDWIEIVRNKGILPEDSLIIYGYDPQKAEEVARQFEKAGYPDITVFNDFFEWAEKDLPMEHLERYEHLVSADWLNQLITTNDAAEYNNDKFVICHSHYRNLSDYDEGHIPGAIPIDTNSLESPETWNRRSPEELKAALEEAGITHDTTVILYGKFSSPNNDDPFPGSSAGHLGAMRCAFIMLYAGVKDVRILNGGLQSWLDSGYEITTSPSKSEKVSFGIDIPQKPEIAVDLEEAKDILASPDKNLVSVRSWKEYIGEVSGYNYIEKKGRIPGAVFGDCGTDAYHMENYRNLDHTMREFREIAEHWKKLGITPDKRNAFYCGTGWRGSEAFLNAWLMGWDKAAVYDGGWFEWSNNNLPFETGVPKE
ncbi:rhodanese-like domain-containing protein [Methanohalophilus halophilus]|uniref:Sulfurtransferase n=1 Tax=Methanohalophilus halophilus TaxID=2177 RepID=A0A1L3Q205_9EURY|nr:rhodanese-like domain-containing protein [Methanohalophilus halophilus]APH38904.1 thiosulfate sulfurtransferase [Methanohalophilus halophilus]RNI07470.1 sulfurtransferase [Methanohalophilus halophilus]SDW67492.1 thiosulfate/3-mercaptopyruvate sulfurtransferase [Methanohalophilus halophilus]